MVKWRKRKQGTPKQIGQAFPLDDKSQQQKKGLLDAIKGKLGYGHASPESKYLNMLRDKLAEFSKTPEERLPDGIFSDSEAEYLEKKGLIKVDPLTEDMSLTPEGQVVLAKETLKKREHALRTLTEYEKELIMKKREQEEIEGEGRR